LKKQILRLAIPNVISNITVPLVGIIEIALVGHLGSPAYIGGVGFGTMVFTLIYTGLGFLRMGTTGLTAQAYGAGDFRGTASILFRALIFSIIAGFTLIALQNPIEKLLISGLHGSEMALHYAGIYFRTRIYAAPATLAIFVFMGWFIGMQNSKIPMIITIIISVSNILFSGFFVLYSEKGISGVALGTVVSQYLGLAFCLFFYLKYFKRTSLLFKIKSVLDITAMKRFFVVSSDIFIRSLLLTGSFFLFNAVSASLGDDVLALNSVMLQFLWFFAYVVDGFSYASGTLSGRFKGENDHFKLQAAVSKSIVFGFFIAIVFTLIYIFATVPVFHLLTDNLNVIKMAQSYKYWIWIMPLTAFSAFIYDGIYIGITATKIQRNIMLFVVLVLFVPILFIFKNIAGNHGMWAAITVLMLARGIGLRVFLKRALHL
jgi:MATE family multidrug resistance protein